MARHPDSPFKRQFAFGTEKRERPVDAAGHCRSFVALKRSVDTQSGDSTDSGNPSDKEIGFKGHAAVFDTRALIGSTRYGFYEEFAPGSFKKTIQEADVRFLINHDTNLILARTKAGTLRLSEDKVGLAVDADMGPYSYAEDLAIALERGDVTQMSIAFDPIQYEISENAQDGLMIVRHTECRLWDVSAVAVPAYETTDAALRNAFERLCRATNLTPNDVIELDETELVSRFAQFSNGLHEPEFSIGRSRPVGQPLDGTGTAENTPPAETTDVPFNPHFRMAQLRMAELAASFQ